MTAYDKTDINNLLLQENLFITAEIVIPELIRTNHAQVSSGRRGVLSKEKYETDEVSILSVAKTIIDKGAIICVSPTSKCKSTSPRTDETLWSLIKIAKKKILIVAPFISNKFIDDLGKTLSQKTNITTIITSAPENNNNPLLHKKLIELCRRKGFELKITKHSLHAKVYIFDGKIAIMGSSNFTRQGFFENLEMNVVLFGSNCEIMTEFIRELDIE